MGLLLRVVVVDGVFCPLLPKRAGNTFCIIMSIIGGGFPVFVFVAVETEPGLLPLPC